MATSVFNFQITSDERISQCFLSNGIADFGSAMQYIRQLPYRRNADKNGLTTVLSDQCGTCSTKHAALQQLAIENGANCVHLILGIFRMNKQNTGAVTDILANYGLDCIPEAHVYLKVDGEITDCTNSNSSKEDFINDLVSEIEIMPWQIADFKVAYHRQVLAQWLDTNPDIRYSEGELFAIRELCIERLSQR